MADTPIEAAGGAIPPGAPVRIRRYALAIMAFWSAAVGIVLTWELLDEVDQVYEVSLSEAREIWRKEQAIYRWAATRQRIYLPVSPQTRPDPRLASLPDRDVTTPSGAALTLASPPDVMRQILAMDTEPAVMRGRITSLRPLNPANAPDPWEKRALARLAEGQPEVSAEETIDGKGYLRLMRPLRTAPVCLSCHAEQGRKVGQLRGGLSVAVALAPAWAAQMSDIVHRIVGYSGMWLLGLVGIALLSRRFQHTVSRRAAAEARLREAHDLLEHRVAERTAELADANRNLQSEIVERRQAEQWLLESEQHFRGYFEQGLVGMAILSPRRQWVEVNQRLCRMLGYTEDELLLKTWSELTHPADRADEDLHFQRLREGVASGFILDERLLRKDGSVLHAGLSAQCMRKADGTVDCLLILVQEMPDPRTP